MIKKFQRSTYYVTRNWNKNQSFGTIFPGSEGGQQTELWYKKLNIIEQQRECCLLIRRRNYFNTAAMHFHNVPANG